MMDIREEGGRKERESEIMASNSKYTITRDYIDKGKSRPKEKNDGISFIVAHDTGNPGSTAYVNRAYFAKNIISASAHTFIDDSIILEIIPLTEKAWHVRYVTEKDNLLYNGDANDKAIGVELCWGGGISFIEAYDRYVWYHAYLCDKYKLDPESDIVAHSTLDPTRRTDPENALNRYGITWSTFIEDVTGVWKNFKEISSPGKVKSTTSTLIVSAGDRGKEVERIQDLLIRVGMDLREFGADGIFGRETQEAVEKFQRLTGLVEDGIVGPKTLGALKRAPKGGFSMNAPVRPYPGRYVMNGDRGKDVEAVQRAVNVNPDGIFGPATEKAVRAYQKRKGLSVDGIVGPDTWNMLF